MARGERRTRVRCNTNRGEHSMYLSWDQVVFCFVPSSAVKYKYSD